MSRSKYINTFETTSDYNNYIESAYPEFPNVGYDKEAGEVKIMRTSPNNHLFYGELVDATQNIPNIQLYNGASKVKTYTPTVDTFTNEFYIDDWGTVPTFNKLSVNFLTNKSNIKLITKFKGLNTSSVTDMSKMFQNCGATSIDTSFNTSNVTRMDYMFSGAAGVKVLDLSSFDISNVTNMEYMLSWCTSLIVLDLSNWDMPSSTSFPSMFVSTNNLTDVYITVESTLMKLTNNLTSQGNNYIPSSATIHYNGTDYKWQNNAWTPQSV